MFSKKFCPECLLLPCCEHSKNNHVGFCDIERDYNRLTHLKSLENYRDENGEKLVPFYTKEGGSTILPESYFPVLDDYNIKVRKYLYENEDFILRFDNQEKENNK